MSVIASASATIKFVGKSGTYTVIIMSPQGDIWQEWQGDLANNPNPPLVPDFEQLKPVMYFVCTSSRVLEGLVSPSAINYEFNGTLLTFDPTTFLSTNPGLQGVFKKIFPSSGQPYYGLQILKNIAPLSGYASASIRMEATVTYGTQSDQIQASFPISIQQSTGTAYSVHIVAGDNYNFVITKKNTSVKLKAKTYQAGAEIPTTGLTYVWEKMGPTGWQTLTTQTGQEITVTNDDINAYGEYRVTVKKDNVPLGSDVQGVMDVSDPFDIDLCPVPADQTITEDTSGNGQVVYTPKVVKRGTTDQVLPSALFDFVVKSAAGNILGTSSAPCASYTVTRAMCIQGGGSLEIFVTANA